MIIYSLVSRGSLYLQNQINFAQNVYKIDNIVHTNASILKLSPSIRF